MCVVCCVLCVLCMGHITEERQRERVRERCDLPSVVLLVCCVYSHARERETERTES